MIKEITPANNLKGELTIPGDKSISHRALLLGALAEGKTEISGFLPGADCLSTLECLRQMGVMIERPTETNVIIKGSGLNGLKEPSQVLDAGNSGTTARLLLGILAGQRFFSALTGDFSLRQRPMGRVVEPLKQMGAQISGRQSGNLLPLAVTGKQLHGIDYLSPVASAQLKSALLLAGLYAEGPTSVMEPSKSRDHSERMLQFFGAKLHVDGLKVTIHPGGKMEARKVVVPGDISSAAFFIVAGLIVPNSELLIKNVGINPTRTGLITALQQMNGQIEVINRREEVGEPVADLLIKSSDLKAATIKGDIIPTLIDEVPALTVAALFAEGETVIMDAAELRVKESDRIAVLAEELQKIGGQVQELPDGLRIRGGRALRGSLCSSHHDHRIAMALAVAGLRTEGKMQIADFECTAISYPGFAEDLKRLCS